MTAKRASLRNTSPRPPARAGKRLRISDLGEKHDQFFAENRLKTVIFTCDWQEQGSPRLSKGGIL